MVHCLSSLMGLAIGFATGWAFHFLIPADGSEWIDAATRLLMLLFGVYGWAFAEIVGHERQLYCGGTNRLDTSSRQRYKQWGVVCIPLSFLTVGFISTGHLVLYFFAYLVLVLLLIGEVCWGDPWQLVDIAMRRTRKNLK